MRLALHELEPASRLVGVRQVVQLDLLPAPPPRHLKPHSELAPRRRPTANPGWARASAPACSASRCELAAEAGVAALACVCVCGVAIEARVTATPITAAPSTPPPPPPLRLPRSPRLPPLPIASGGGAGLRRIGGGIPSPSIDPTPPLCESEVQGVLRTQYLLFGSG